MVDCGVLEAGGQNPVGTSSGGMAVITRGGYVDTTLGRLSMDTVFIDRDRMIDQDFVFAGNVQVLMAFAACRGQIHRMRLCPLHAGRQDIMVAMAIRALRHVLAIANFRPAVTLVLFRGLYVAGPASLASRSKCGILHMRHLILVRVTVKTLHSLVGRVFDIIDKRCAVTTLLMAPLAVFTGYCFSFLFLCLFLFLGKNWKEEN